MLHQTKAPQFYTDLGLQKTVLNPIANGKIQGLFFFKYFSRQILLSRSFQDSPVYSSTFQACANPEFIDFNAWCYFALRRMYHHMINLFKSVTHKTVTKCFHYGSTIINFEFPLTCFKLKSKCLF